MKRKKKEVIKISEWKCGKCGKVYDMISLMRLNKVQANPKDKNPREQHGYHPVCPCGYEFHKDKWKKNDEVKFSVPWFWFLSKTIKGKVSTVFLELSHSGYYYETMIFLKESRELNMGGIYQKRYISKKKAKREHRKLVRQIKNNKITIKKSKFGYYGLEEIKDERKNKNNCKRKT